MTFDKPLSVVDWNGFNGQCRCCRKKPTESFSSSHCKLLEDLHQASIPNLMLGPVTGRTYSFLRSIPDFLQVRLWWYGCICKTDPRLCRPRSLLHSRKSDCNWFQISTPNQSLMVVLSRMRIKNDIEAFNGRYIDESSIMALELANEPRCAGSTG